MVLLEHEDYIANGRSESLLDNSHAGCKPQPDSYLLPPARIRRTYLMRRMDDEVTDELIQQVIELQDASIQTKLVRDSRLSRRHAELLAKRGANPTIRENARAWFQDKSFWR